MRFVAPRPTITPTVTSVTPKASLPHPATRISDSQQYGFNCVQYTNTMTSRISVPGKTFGEFDLRVAADPHLRCQTCEMNLTTVDKHKTSNKYYKNCQKCRDKNAESKRKRLAMRATPAAPSIGLLSGASPYTRKRSPKKFQRFPREAEPDQAWRWPINTVSSDTMRSLSKLPKSDLDDAGSEPPVKRRRHDAYADIKALGSRNLKLNLGSRAGVLYAEFCKLVEETRKAKKAEISIAKASDEPSNPTVSEQPNERECSACAESLPVKDFPNRTDCDHDPDVCHECFLQWLNQRMANMENITCPSSGCNNAVTHAEVQKYASKDDFTRFDELSMRSFLSADTDFLYCLAEGCQSGQVHDTGVEGPIFRCAACGYRMCIAHKPVIPFHENEVCTQYNKRIEQEEAELKAREEEVRIRTQQEEEARVKRKQEKASAAELAKSSVKCPGCGVQIQKIGGCDHMTCRRKGCGFQFCYLCRAPYHGPRGINTIGNSAHARSCRHHSARLPSYV